MACRKEERPDLRGSSLKMDEGKPAGGRNGGNPVGFWESSALILLSFIYLFIFFTIHSIVCGGVSHWSRPGSTSLILNEILTSDSLIFAQTTLPIIPVEQLTLHRDEG